VVLACGLGVLQGCRSGDAASPLSAEPSAPVAPAAPRNIRLASDTVTPSIPLVVTGDDLPLNSSAVSATLNGVPLPVRALSAVALELDVPRAFPCAATATAKLLLAVGSTVVERTVLLRTAMRVALTSGETRTFGDVGGSLCLELAANDSASANSASATGAASAARFVVAVVNTKPFAATSPSWSMRGMGTGAAAGVPSTERVTATSSLVRSDIEVAGVGADQSQPSHVERLAQRAVVAGGVPAAGVLWRQRTVLRPAAITRTVAEGDTVRFMAMSGSCHKGQAIQARAVYAGARVVVFADAAATVDAGTDAAYRQLGAEYDAVMHPLLVEQVGNPLAMDKVMNGSGRVSLLFTRFVNDSMAGTAAYVSACNFYPRATFSASNEAAVVYGRLPSRGESPAEWRRAMRATVMHEAKHLASFAERMAAGRDFEEPWLEEATARVAEELYARTFTPGAAWRGGVGFAASVQCEVLQCDDRPLVMWKHFSGLHAWLRTASSVRVGQLTGESGTALNASAANAAYASGWALVRWVLDRYAVNERAAVRALVAGGAHTGMAALAGLAGVSESELMTEWAAHVAADGSPRASLLAASPSTWSSADIFAGMASMFPGVFASQPLAMARRTVGDFSTTAAVLGGTASYLELSGDFSRGGQVVQLTATGALGLAVRRAP
jgi:hypothetical protein